MVVCGRDQDGGAECEGDAVRSVIAERSRGLSAMGWQRREEICSRYWSVVSALPHPLSRVQCPRLAPELRDRWHWYWRRLAPCDGSSPRRLQSSDALSRLSRLRRFEVHPPRDVQHRQSVLQPSSRLPERLLFELVLRHLLLLPLAAFVVANGSALPSLRLDRRSRRSDLALGLGFDGPPLPARLLGQHCGSGVRRGGGERVGIG